MWVDRRHSALGNPYVMGCERDRDAACTAYGRLLDATLAGVHAGPGREVVEMIGRCSGFGGEVRGWDWAGARREMEALRARVGAGERLRLLCHCAPRRCHGDEICRHLVP